MSDTCGIWKTSIFNLLQGVNFGRFSVGQNFVHYIETFIFIVSQIYIFAVIRVCNKLKHYYLINFHLIYCILLFQGFLRNERENALLAVIEQTRQNVRPFMKK